MNKGLEGTGVALGSLGNTVSSSNGSFNTLKEIISSAKEELNTILSELNEVEDGEKYDQFIRILSFLSHDHVSSGQLQRSTITCAKIFALIKSSSTTANSSGPCM